MLIRLSYRCFDVYRMQRVQAKTRRTTTQTQTMERRVSPSHTQVYFINGFGHLNHSLVFLKQKVQTKLHVPRKVHHTRLAKSNHQVSHNNLNLFFLVQFDTKSLCLPLFSSLFEFRLILSLCQPENYNSYLLLFSSFVFHIFHMGPPCKTVTQR